MWCFLRSQQTHEERNVEVFIWNLPWLNPNIRGTYLSSIPLSFQVFLIASSLPFLFFSFYMCDLLLKRISQEWKWNPAFWHNKMQNWWPHGPSFSEKKVMSCCPRGTWHMVANQLSIALSYLPLTKTHVASQDTFMFTWQRAHNKKTNKRVGAYLRHPSEKTYYWIIAPLYSQVRLWVSLCLLLKISCQSMIRLPKRFCRKFRLCQPGSLQFPV